MFKEEIKNNPHWFIYVLIIAGGTIVPGIYFMRNEMWDKVGLLAVLLLLICLAASLRKVIITISEKNINIKFYLVGIKYKEISADFDKIRGNDVIIFTKNEETTLWVDYGYDYEGKEVYAKSIELRYKNKIIHIGNNKNSDKAFNELAIFCRKHPFFYQAPNNL